MLRTHEQKLAAIRALAARDHEVGQASSFRYCSLVNAGDEEYAEEYACARRELEGISTQHALTHPSCARPIPGSTGIGYGTQRSLISTNLSNGNLRTYGGGKLWRWERKAGRKTAIFTPVAMVAPDGSLTYL